MTDTTTLTHPEAALMLGAFATVTLSAGVAMWRHPESVAQFFDSAARPIFSAGMRRRVYTAKNARWAAGAYVGFGLLCAGLCIWMAVLSVTGA